MSTTAAPLTDTAAARRTDLALAVLRVVVGGLFLAHGAQKLFVYGFGGVSGAFAGMGIPLPGVAGPLTGLVEFLGGLALVAGLLTRLAAAGLAVVMLGAIGFVHLGAGFFGPQGFEFPLTLLAAAVALVIAGGGRYALDAVIARTRRAPWRDAERTPAGAASAAR